MSRPLLDEWASLHNCNGAQLYGSGLGWQHLRNQHLVTCWVIGSSRIWEEALTQPVPANTMASVWRKSHPVGTDYKSFRPDATLWHSFTTILHFNTETWIVESLASKSRLFVPKSLPLYINTSTSIHTWLYLWTWNNTEDTYIHLRESLSSRLTTVIISRA